MQKPSEPQSGSLESQLELELAGKVTCWYESGTRLRVSRVAGDSMRLIPVAGYGHEQSP